MTVAVRDTKNSRLEYAGLDKNRDSMRDCIYSRPTICEQKFK